RPWPPRCGPSKPSWGLEPMARRLIALIAGDGREPAADLSDRDASAAWAAVSAPWHPAILARLDELPRIESEDTPSPPEPGDLRTLATGSGHRLPSGYRAQAEAAGAVVLEGHLNRFDLARQILKCLDP